MDNVLGELLAQLPFAITEIVPEAEPAVTEIELVAELPDHPEGNVHEYDVAPETGATEYACVDPEQTIVLPEIKPG